MQIEQLCNSLSAIAPLRLAESWDNVGLLVGDRRAECQRVMVCLTITPAVVQEAKERRADLIVAHHPLPFKALARLTTDTIAAGMVLDLAAHSIAVYSAHTAFDSAAGGINEQLAHGVGLTDIAPLAPAGGSADLGPSKDDAPTADDFSKGLGSGRYGVLSESTTLGELAQRIGKFLNLDCVRVVSADKATQRGPTPLAQRRMPTSDSADSLKSPAASTTPVTRVALACGSGGGFLDTALRRGCDAMITGEATFHTCLQAQASGVSLVLLGHYASERFAMEKLAEALSREHSELTVWASERESDPLQMLTV